MLTHTFSKTGARSQVTFKLKIARDLSGGSVVGDFNNWTPGAHKLKADKSGHLTAIVSLPSNKRFAFKFLTTGGAWLNDDAADDYHTNEWGESNSIVDTTLPANFSTVKSAPKKKATTKKAPAKKAAAKKTTTKKVAKKKTAVIAKPAKTKKDGKPKSDKSKKTDK